MLLIITPLLGGGNIVYSTAESSRSSCTVFYITYRQSQSYDCGSNVPM